MTAFRAPGNRQVLIRSIQDSEEGKVVNVSIPGSDIKPAWQMTGQGLSVKLPNHLPNKLGYVIAVEMSKETVKL